VRWPESARPVAHWGLTVADGTKIEWTDATWNVLTGCSIESPGCTNCYAMKLAGTRLRNHPSRAGLTKDSAAGPVWTGEVRFNEQWLRQPLQWKRPRMIFPAAHGDLFHPMVQDAWLDSIFAVMALTRHTFQCLTKRPARALEYLQGLSKPAGKERLQRAALALGYTFEFQGDLLVFLPLRNVLIGCSVENQRYADARRSPMSEIARLGWATWVSYEPALGPVQWDGWDFLRWLVSGGESGPAARPHHPDWHRGARDFCADHGIAYNFKQWGAWAPDEGPRSDGTDPIFEGKGTCAKLLPDGTWEQSESGFTMPLGPRGSHDLEWMYRIGKKAAGRLLDGVEHNAFPETAA
jgi:protein gp37